MATSIEESEKKLVWIDNIPQMPPVKIGPVDPEIALLNLIKRNGRYIRKT